MLLCLEECAWRRIAFSFEILASIGVLLVALLFLHWDRVTRDVIKYAHEERDLALTGEMANISMRDI